MKGFRTVTLAVLSLAFVAGIHSMLAAPAFYSDEEAAEIYSDLKRDFETNEMFSNDAVNDFRDRVPSPWMTADHPWKNEDNVTSLAAIPLTSRELRELPDYRMLSRKVFMLAMKGMRKIVGTRSGVRRDLLTVVDFDQSYFERRMYVFDLKNRKVLFNTYTAAGINSDEDKDGMIDSFSNVGGSWQSSPGFFLTGETYESGEWGYALRVDGIDGNLNSAARSRAIVIHGMKSIETRAIATRYRTFSNGCFSIPRDESGRLYGLEDRPLKDLIIDEIKGKSVLFAYTTLIDLPAASKYLAD